MAPAFLVDYTGHKELDKLTNRGSGLMMGKSQRFSKGYSSGFVSDYRYSVENMAESEGFGSSGRVEDDEMTDSEDFGAPKRKCISLNAESRDGFGIPLQVHSLSQMSHSERKDLKVRLKVDLDKVRVLQKRLELHSTNAASLLDSHRAGDRSKKPSTENFQRTSEFTAGVGKKQVSSSRHGQHSKRDHSGRFKSKKHGAAGPLEIHTKVMKQCEALLKRLMSHQSAWIFNEPVDIVKMNAPDYFTVIKHPMDFLTIKNKIASGQYTSPLGFLADVRLTFSNALTYNPPENAVHDMALTMSKLFEGRWKPIEKKLQESELIPAHVDLDDPGEVEPRKLSPHSKKRRVASIDQDIKTEPVKKIMSNEEKQNLNKDLVSLIAELPVHIIQFLKDHSSTESQIGEDEFEVDIDILSDDTLFSLRKLIDDYMREKNENHAKAARGQTEVLDESGHSNSPLQPRKGHNVVDEDIDIGGNDPPASSFPTVEIVKDTAQRNSQSSASSSSNSDTSSSSSDSDSGSSSSSDSEEAKASTPANVPKENKGSVADADLQTDDRGRGGNQSVSESDQVDQNPQSKPSLDEADNKQEGESALPERQVSPEKLYRAALLRSRFADTILKAREKAITQGEKVDPEKLRREREEHEKLQREDKARLQAEAKAAEDARRLAEAEAAAEAKKKLELEREAARKAILEMEKTVEIDENPRFLQDLEMLQSGPPPQLPSVEELSADPSLGGLNPFKLQGSNPLEQLGLYMKMDEEEEEGNLDIASELEPDIASKPQPDVEEGEID
ncbi:hypothetical protein Syun_020298 [Stephania yunnanensis]|uniref:Transcription factor GTE8 n=1 Tax=Stephania yunnanensis TaxID=152371 RepID=A0AAP0NRC2_9MAGN